MEPAWLDVAAPHYKGDVMSSNPPDERPGSAAGAAANEGAADVPGPDTPVQPAQPHDAFFRSIFGDPAHAAAVLQSILPPSVAAHIDWPTTATSTLAWSARCRASRSGS